MLQDREYMRGPRGASPLPNFFSGMTAVKMLLIANVAVFVIEQVFRSFFGSDWFVYTFSLSSENVSHFYLWSFLTYSFLHGAFWHIAMNMLVLFFVGPALEMRIGFRRFMYVYFASAFAGGAVWYLFDIIGGGNGYLIGASAGVFGMFAAFCMLEADKRMTFLLFFLIPITVRPRVLLAFMAGFELFNFLFNEIAPHSHGSHVGYSAHLGGIAAGIAAAFVLDGKIPFILRRKKRGYGSASDYSFRVNILSDDELRAETNRILDKINTRGFSSLSDREKEILSIAKDRLK